MTRGKRYGTRFKDTWLIPTVEVTGLCGFQDTPFFECDDTHIVVVKTVRGWTRAHAFERALRWSRRYGDPR